MAASRGEYALAAKLHTCEGGCGQMIEFGLALRFCPACRDQQPTPTNRKRYPVKKQVDEPVYGDVEIAGRPV